MEGNIEITKIDYERLKSLLSSQSLMRGSAKDSLAKLAIEINRARKIEPAKISPDVITMNTTLEFMDMDSQVSKQLKLVYPGQANMKLGYVSITAPVGTAFLGYRKGDIIEWDVPAGRKKFLIKDIIYQPEAHGEDLE
jgi:regulator of nucleoside diphosphate kinase